MDVRELPLKTFTGKHLVIIAGVGGELMAEFIDAIYQKNPDSEIDFLLCPVNDPFTVRRKLIKLGFRLQYEILVLENERFYEVLLVSASNNEKSLHSKISAVGVHIWKGNNAEQSKNAKQYLTKTIAHYKRKQKGFDSNVQNIIDAYDAVAISHS
jgi:tRNA (adenine22-N1)-methyltransferase